MSVIWSIRAIHELEACADRIADDNPLAARAWAERIEHRANAVAKMPRSGRVVPEYARADVREVFVGAYRIIYVIESSHIRILALIEGQMELPDELDPDAAE